MFKEMTYVSASPMYRDRDLSPMALTPIKQEYYWVEQLAMQGLKLPCWHHNFPSVFENTPSSRNSIQRLWFVVEEDFTNIRSLSALMLTI